jgi:hypothetical protein
MSWAGKQHPVEAAIEWLAPVPLALAVGWAGWRLGLPSIASIPLGLVALVLGLAAIRLAGGSSVAIHDFQPTEFMPIEADELVLEEQDAVLELSDRLEEAGPDSRVVRLFERQEPTPGELVDRIVDFLAEGRRHAPADRPAAGDRPPVDASAALHDALANIRASLR